jgi:hypothetical protein
MPARRIRLTPGSDLSGRDAIWSLIFHFLANTVDYSSLKRILSSSIKIFCSPVIGFLYHRDNPGQVTQKAFWGSSHYVQGHVMI